MKSSSRHYRCRKLEKLWCDTGVPPVLLTQKTRAKHLHRHTGFTLVEMMISLSIVSVIVVASASVVTLAARSMSSTATNGSSTASLTAASTTQVSSVRSAMD